MKQLPNIMTLSRIFLSIVLLFLIRQPSLFFVVYFLAGLTDLLDGYVARRYHLQSALGARLDSFADFCLFVICFIIFLIIGIDLPVWLIGSIVICALLRIINLAITFLKFQQFSIMHTILNKVTGFSCWISFPFLLFLSTLTSVIGGIVVVIALVSTLEEMMILLTSTQYDIDQKRWNP